MTRTLPYYDGSIQDAIREAVVRDGLAPREALTRAMTLMSDTFTPSAGTRRKWAKAAARLEASRGKDQV